MRTNIRRTTATALVSALAVTALAACGTSSDKDDTKNQPSGGSTDVSAPLDPKTKVTISMDCMPPAAKKAELKQWKEDVAEFNKTYPNVTIEGRSTPGQCLEPPRFTAMLKAKSQPDVFYAYFTDLKQVLDNDGAEDISGYVTAKTVPGLDDIDKNVVNILKQDGKLYGVPTSNYTMGLLVNRKLFKDAGLDPDQPPRTWEEVRAAAKKIAALGNGTAGFGEYSVENTGGWHFTATMYGMGGDVVGADGKAAFNNPTGKQIVDNLRAMRWEDDSMGKTQLLKWGDLQKQMASDKLGMFLAAPDDITYMVQQLGGKYENFGMGPIPGGAATLAGGNGYMIKKGSSPDKIKAAIAWLNFKTLSVGKGQFQYDRSKTDALPVGLPQPAFFTGASKAKDDELKAASATMPVVNFKSFLDNPVAGKPEPAKAQEVYKVLDKVMSGVLTNKDADTAQLLAEAEKAVNQVLANQ